MKTLIASFILVIAFTTSASAQSDGKDITVDLKGKPSRIYKGETQRSFDIYRVKGRKGRIFTFQAAAPGKMAVFQVSLIKAGSKKGTEPLTMAWDQRAYDYEFQVTGDELQIAIGALRGAGVSYSLTITEKAVKANLPKPVARKIKKGRIK